MYSAAADRGLHVTFKKNILVIDLEMSTKSMYQQKCKIVSSNFKLIMYEVQHDTSHMPSHTGGSHA